MPAGALYVVNPVAGRGRASRAAAWIGAELRRRGVGARFVVSQAAGHAEDLARRGAREGHSPIVVVGGDGTLQEVVNGLLDAPHPPPLGVVPAGTGNDFARGLSLPLDPRAAVEVVCRGRAGPVDLGRCGERYYVNAGGVGFDAEVAAARWPGGRLAYAAAVVRELWRYANRDLVIDLDGRVLRRRALLVAVTNGRFYGGGMMICPEARPADGRLDVCIVGDVGRAEVLRLLPSVFSGRHVGHPKVELARAQVVRVEGAPGTRGHLDGEPIDGPVLEFRVVPAALAVLGATARPGS